MTHHAKATSAGSTEAGGSSRGLLRRAFATRGACSDPKGSGAPSSRRVRSTLAVLALAIAAFAISAAPALAVPPSTTTPVVSNASYASAHVSGQVATDGSGFFGATAYAFQISTDNATWSTAISGNLFGAATKTIEADITGLKGATQYFVRLVANNGFLLGAETLVPSPLPNPSFTTLAVDPPTIPGTVGTSQIFSTSATATGKVKRPANADPAFDVNACRFEYITDADFTATGFAGATAVPCDQATPFATPPNGETDVTAALTGLSSSTTYHLRLAVENAAPGAVTKDAAATFTTAPKVAPPTVIATDDATEVGKRSAQVSAEVQRPAGADPALDTSCRFEYVTDAQFTAEGFEGAGQAPCPGRNEVQSLTVAATAGQFRLVYSGQTLGGQANAQATANLPFDATALEVAGALEGIVGTRGFTISGGPGDGAGSTPYRITFIHDLFIDLGEQDQSQLVVTDGTTPLAGTANVTTLINGGTAFEVLNGPPTNQPKEIGAELTGLEPDTTYHLRLTAENSGGTDTKEAAGTFKTIALIPPTIATGSATEVGYTSTRANGTADPGNQGVFWAFEYSINPGLEGWHGGPSFGGPSISAGSPPEAVSTKLTGLLPGTTYKLRLGAFDAEAFNGFNSPEPYEEVTTKGTSAPASVTFNPVTAVTATSAHFSAAVDTHPPAGPLSDEAKAAYNTKWRIECTPECPGPGGEPFSGTVQAEEGSKAIAVDPALLHANTFYEVELIAENVLGTVESPLQTFQTPLVLPSVKAEAGASDGEGGYFIQGVINSNNSKVTSCVIEYGTTATYPNTYQAPCLPSPSGPNEVQNIGIDAGEGQFKLSFRGQTTSDLPFNASTVEVQTALRALSQVGATGVNVTGSPGAYVVTFAGKLAGTNVEPIKASDGTTPLGGGGGASVSTPTEGGLNHPVTVEAHVENLTIGSTYHFRIFATNAAGSISTTDREFVPTLATKENCPNEQLRKENSSEALPECRAYEMVTPSDKAGYATAFIDYYAGAAVAYESAAGNIANSGTGSPVNFYVADRTASGWQTRANLNGPPGTDVYGPENPFHGGIRGGVPWRSRDLVSSVWPVAKEPLPGAPTTLQLVDLYRGASDGTFVLMGKSAGGTFDVNSAETMFVGASDDLEHMVWDGTMLTLDTAWGPGVYEFVGASDELPRRIDVDNAGSPISGVGCGPNAKGPQAAYGNAVSRDGRVVVFTARACPGGPAQEELWARVGGTTSIDVSASQCDRLAPACNGQAGSVYRGASEDGSRVFFTTTQQLLNGDTDQTNDLYACDIPSGTPAPIGKANPCSSLKQISVAESGGAEVENVLRNSEDGSTVLFTAKGVLAANEDALGETAQLGGHNLYLWRQDPGHPAGQTIFVGRLTSGITAQITSDGRYLALDTATSLLPTDTDNGADVYRYDSETGEMLHVSTGPTGTGGNTNDFDAEFTHPTTASVYTHPVSGRGRSESEHNPHYSISDDGQKIIFDTAEALSPRDGNAAPDVYLWTPGRVSLISTGSVDGAIVNGEGNAFSSPVAAIGGSGRDIYFETNAALSPADGDQRTDVYDARIDGGFSFTETTCSGEACQPAVTPPPPDKPRATEQPGVGNPEQPKLCPKGKVRRHGRCVKKPSRKHPGKKHHGKKASHVQGGGK